MIAFIAGMLGLSLLPIEDAHLTARICHVACAAGVEALTLVIYKTEKIFWYNGVSYQEAVEAGSDRRRAYALKYVKRFGILTVGILVFSFIAQLLRLNIAFDTAAMVIGLVVCALSTVKLKP
ncbi:MAG: hypothetical protein NC432_08900 [Roseburia sp.]|nr:hypothetical protein [Roseburia sp.]MCM1099428.1 hypothetical protein [Ruminococcus flavefaciens]